MILGMSTATFTLLHVLISLVGIGSGLVVIYGFLTSNRLDRWTLLFLVTTVATSVTGFFFPIQHLTPGLVVGVLSLLLLAVAIGARYSLQMKGAWCATYVVTASIALYFNVFVLVVQSFEKVPALHALAPTQKESPFAVAQLLILAVFATLTVLALKRFHPGSSAAASGLASSDKKRAA